MRSGEGEAVQFKNVFPCDGMKPEEWLAKLIDHIGLNLREQLHRCIDARHELARDRWLFEYSAQLVVVASQTWWSSDVNDAFEKLEQGSENALQDYLATLTANLAALTATLMRSDISRGDRVKSFPAGTA
ncbi:hypothetical protein T492DRAFT_520393 [Pavlovales sp. CCMP2436]|nr:hypothetical protein T492DRAFT_520393 [Pavlovales sp. CCMP2436]